MAAPLGDAEHTRLLQASDERARAGPRIDVGRQSQCGGKARLLATGLLAAALLGAAALLAARGRQQLRVRAAVESTVGAVAVASEDHTWGCGYLGYLPGVTPDGKVSSETQRLIDALKATSSLGLVSYWNWNLAPETQSGKPQILTKDFVFMPEQWGVGVVEEKYVRQAGVANFLDGTGQTCPATMGDIFLGSNEPDISGSCMGDMFGRCSSACDDAAVAAGDCPEAHLDSKTPAMPNSKGQCNCWQDSHATGVGFWPIDGCAAHQPLPDMWSDPACSGVVLDNWKKTAAIAYSKGYKYLSTPLVAVDLDYARKFIAAACKDCQDISCGCPVYVGWHFYANDCMPQTNGGYDVFKGRLETTADIMKEFPFVKGAIINEVGMLNCGFDPKHPAICVPDQGEYPASKQKDFACPSTPDLPNGLASFIEKLFELVIAAKTDDGRPVVKAFSWFNLDQDGGTYNLQLFDDEGNLNELGEAYIDGCRSWAKAMS